VGLFSNNAKHELILELGKLQGMERDAERYLDSVDESPEAMASFGKISRQAEHCLNLLDQLEANCPKRYRRQLEAQWTPIRDSVEKRMLLYHAASRRDGRR
jgi:hypothetical protein